MEQISAKKSEVANQKPRDEHGHFVPLEKESPQPTISQSNPPPPAFSQPTTNPVMDFVHKETSVKKTNDDETLVDVRVNNPLTKITKILEDIKKQKAFSFNIKGSLGVAGILVIVTTFGIFGGTQAFCSKGISSHIGTIMPLAYTEEKSPSIIDRAKLIWDSLSGAPMQPTILALRTVLIERNQLIYHIVGLKNQRNIIAGASYIVTGEVDSCSQTITVDQENAVESY